jgi:hypothetical protein
VAEELDEAIRTNAEGPKSASGDSGSMQQHSIPDQIAADRYLASQEGRTVEGPGGSPHESGSAGSGLSAECGTRSAELNG